MRDNPFTPSFGTLPAVLVGRENVMAGIRPLLATVTKNNRHWATMLRAHRGAGKTCLLDQIQDAATELGWWVLQEDAGSGPLTNRLINRALMRLEEHEPPRRGRRVTSVSAFGASVGLEAQSPVPSSVTSVRDVLATVAQAEDNGVLVTIDEIHQASARALNEIGNAAQHLHRDGFAFVLVTDWSSSLSPVSTTSSLSNCEHTTPSEGQRRTTR